MNHYNVSADAVIVVLTAVAGFLLFLAFLFQD